MPDGSVLGPTLYELSECASKNEDVQLAASSSGDMLTRGW